MSGNCSTRAQAAERRQEAIEAPNLPKIFTCTSLLALSAVTRSPAHVVPQHLFGEVTRGLLSAGFCIDYRLAGRRPNEGRHQEGVGSSSRKLAVGWRRGRRAERK